MNRWQFVACAFLTVGCLIVTDVAGAEPPVFGHRLTLPLDYDPAAYRSPFNQVVPRGVAFSPDAKKLAVAFDQQGVLLFDLPSGQLASRIKESCNRGYCVAFSPDGNLLAYSGDGAWIWDLANGRPKSWGDHPDRVRSVAFSPDGKLLAVGTFEKTFHVWEMVTGKSVAEFDVYAGTAPNLDTGLYKPHVAVLDFSPDGKMLAADIHLYEDELPIFDHMQIWDLESQKLKASFNGTGGLFTRNGETLIYGLDGKIRLRSMKAMDEVVIVEGKTRIAPAYLPVMALSGDGKTLAVSGENHTVQLWNLPTRQLIVELKGHTRWITSVAISADGTQVASSSEDSSIRLWEQPPARMNP